MTYEDVFMVNIWCYTKMFMIEFMTMYDEVITNVGRLMMLDNEVKVRYLLLRWIDDNYVFGYNCLIIWSLRC
jgi:hypothetical protein